MIEKSRRKKVDFLLKRKSKLLKRFKYKDEKYEYRMLEVYLNKIDLKNKSLASFYYKVGLKQKNIMIVRKKIFRKENKILIFYLEKIK